MTKQEQEFIIKRADKVCACIKSCNSLAQLFCMEKFVLWFTYNPNRSMLSICIGKEIDGMYRTKVKMLMSGIYN